MCVYVWKRTFRLKSMFCWFVDDGLFNFTGTKAFWWQFWLYVSKRTLINENSRIFEITVSHRSHKYSFAFMPCNFLSSRWTLLCVCVGSISLDACQLDINLEKKMRFHRLYRIIPFILSTYPIANYLMSACRSLSGAYIHYKYKNGTMFGVHVH